MVSNQDKKSLEINLQAYLDYNKTFGKHLVKGLLGYSQIHNQYRLLKALRKDLPANNSLGEIDAGDVTTQETGGKSVTYALRSVFGRINYGFDDRYLFEANLRYDGYLDFLNIIVLDYSLLFHLDGVYRKKTSLKLILLITLS